MQPTSIVLQRRRRDGTAASPNGGALVTLAELCHDKSHGGGIRPTASFSSVRTMAGSSASLISNSLRHRQPCSSSSNVVSTTRISANHLSGKNSTAFHQQNMIREIMLASLSLAKLSESPVFSKEEDNALFLPLAESTSLSSSSSSSSISSRPNFPLISIEQPRVPNRLTNPRLNSSNRGDNSKSTFMPATVATIASASSSPKRTVNRTNDKKGDAFRFREYQVTTWSRRLQEVEAFVSEHGHCMIPSDYPLNQKLAKWAKRQRCQYQLYLSDPSKSSMTIERIRVLEDLGFCWQNKMSVWQSRYQELLQFHLQFGHTQVPSSYKPNQRLATWVKCQRRQKRLRDRGKASSMTNDRIALLDSVNFVWRMYPSNPREWKPKAARK